MAISDWETNYKPNWCPGCGNFGLWLAFKGALEELAYDPGEVVLVAGIGCHGHISNFTKVSSFEGLHGRPIPVAEGIKLARKDLKVVVSTGDGDCLGEGGNHLIHAARRNHDFLVILHNNRSYSLTTGQSSPSSTRGYKSKSTPEGKTTEALEPLALVLAAGGGFVARGFSGEVAGLQKIFKAGLEHRGLAVVEVLQPCPVFNKQETLAFYREKIVNQKNKLQSREEALAAVLARNGKIPVGIFYEEEGSCFEDNWQDLDKKTDWKNLLKEFF